MRGQFPGFGIFGQYCSANRTGNVTFAKLVIQLGYLYFVGRAFFCDTGIAALKRRDLCFQLFFQNGNPGLNMLKNEFSAYYVAGVRLSWNFGNLYTRKNESRQLILNQQDVNVQKETFLFNTHLEITQNNSEIKKLTELMKNDEEIITLRNNIKKSAQAKVANGTLTVTEMLREVTAENIAMQDKILHEIQLLSAIYELKYTTNQYENK